MTRLGDVLLDADPPVHALVVYGANPLASNPDTGKVRRALAREDLFTVVIEQVPTDTVDYADIVLPSTMQTEHTDVHDGYGHMYLAWNEPAVEPPGECLPHTEIFRRLARAMGLEEPALYDDDLTLARTLVESRPPDARGRDGRAAAARGLGPARPPASAGAVRSPASRRRRASSSSTPSAPPPTATTRCPATRRRPRRPPRARTGSR